MCIVGDIHDASVTLEADGAEVAAAGHFVFDFFDLDLQHMHLHYYYHPAAAFVLELVDLFFVE